MGQPSKDNNFSAWSDIHFQYRDSFEKISGYIETNSLTRNTVKKVELEIAAGIKNDMAQMVKKTKHLTIYEYAALSQSDIMAAGLTEKQREVATLRKCFSFEDIADKLGISPKTAFAVYKQAVNKIEKFRMSASIQAPIKLSPQQADIYNLYFIEGYKPAVIAEKLNITAATTKEQLKRIKCKIKRGTK